MIYSELDMRIRNDRDKYKNLSYVYAHGKLQDILNYDLVVTDDMALSDKVYKPEIDKMVLFDTVEDQTMWTHSVRIFLWKDKTINRCIGLICLNNDKEAIQDAKEKYDKMVEYNRL